jgi:hypothetical protein
VRRKCMGRNHRCGTHAHSLALFFLCLIAILGLFLLGKNVASSGRRPTAASRTATVQTLLVSLVKEPSDGARNKRFTLLVSNQGENGCTVDRLFACFFKWHATYEDGTPVETVTDEQQPDSSVAGTSQSRFVPLAVGDSIRTILDLDGKIRCFASGRVHRGPSFGHEYYMRNRIDERHKEVLLSVAYEISSCDKGGFHALFGFDMEEVGLVSIRSQSNEIRLKVNDGEW